MQEKRAFSLSLYPTLYPAGYLLATSRLHSGYKVGYLAGYKRPSRMPSAGRKIPGRDGKSRFRHRPAECRSTPAPHRREHAGNAGTILAPAAQRTQMTLMPADLRRKADDCKGNGIRA